MFTGIIEGQGAISHIETAHAGSRIVINTSIHLDNVQIGDSIAVNGVCLTVVMREKKRFAADISPETVQRTTFCDARPGTRVNLERALKLSDRIDGHLVTGHVDGTARLTDKSSAGNAVICTFSAAPDLCGYMIRKGSVAVDGVSLTINDCGKDFFSVSIIPHTALSTTITDIRPGDAVNIETDMIGKYVAKFVLSKPDAPHTDPKTSKIDMKFLAESGFL